jgi:hypothetical protein
VEGRHGGQGDAAEAAPTPLSVVQRSSMARYRVPGQWQSCDEASGETQQRWGARSVYRVFAYSGALLIDRDSHEVMIDSETLARDGQRFPASVMLRLTRSGSSPAWTMSSRAMAVHRRF